MPSEVNTIVFLIYKRKPYLIYIHVYIGVGNIDMLISTIWQQHPSIAWLRLKQSCVSCNNLPTSIINPCLILLDLYSLHHISHLHHLTPGTPYHDKHHVTSSSSLKMVWFQQKVQGPCVTKLNDLVQVFATFLQGFQLHKYEMYYIIKQMLDGSKSSVFLRTYVFFVDESCETIYLIQCTFIQRNACKGLLRAIKNTLNHH